ncbi:host attachment protein [Myxococcota bacterium]|nr:host attachment protein [Myxococcota bacterium]
MNKLCVVVADGARGRLFSYDPRRVSPRGDCLHEVHTLVNPAHQEADHELYSEHRRAARGHVPGHWYTIDDHRGGHDLEGERRFAAEIFEAARRLVDELDARALVLVADPAMMRHLRVNEPSETKRKVPILELTRTLTKMTPFEIQAALEAHGLLPERPRAVHSR